MNEDAEWKPERRISIREYLSWAQFVGYRPSDNSDRRLVRVWNDLHFFAGWTSREYRLEAWDEVLYIQLHDRNQ